MPKWCVVPNCKSGSRTEVKRSVFRVPKDVATLKKWEEAIPGIVKLDVTDVVCERHFTDEDISREWIKLDANGKVIARVQYKRPQLQKLAVPSTFRNAQTEKENCVPLHEYAKPFSESKTNSGGTANQSNVSVQPSKISTSISTVIDTDTCGKEPSPMEVSSELPVAETFVSQTSVEVQSSVEINISRVSEKKFQTGAAPAPVTGLSLSSMEEVTCEPAEPDLFAPQISAGVPSFPSSRKIRQRIPEEIPSVNYDFSSHVPEGWGWANMRTEIVQQTLFTYAVTKIEDDVLCPVIQKTVTLRADGRLQYFVYGRHVDPQGKNLQLILHNKEALKNVLVKFKGMSICTGIGDVSIDFVQPGTAYQDHTDKWRSKSCTLVSKKKRCESCTKTRKSVQQRESQLKNPSTLSRIGNISNPIDRRKLSAMRMKLRRERCQRIRAQERVKHLTTCIKAQEDEMASIKDTAVEKTLTELNISNSQKIVVQEIITAARKKDSRGRRYADEWIMLCMLMNIRSPKDYEFLRKNNILPLPCMRTIKSYFSLINAKCGFDDEFAKVLEKHFASKTPLQRNGILLLNEINLRKSVEVCSKDSNYSDLKDSDDDGQKSTDIEDHATHGLVVMFQPLADVYTQPIAVFASKNPVKDEELAKIVIKAIPYLEQCGAMIHGIVTDGAGTNDKMWSLLGVKGTMEKTNTWFTHPMDDERKVFVFSDICNGIKNVRNRLFDKEKLRLPEQASSEET